MRRLRVLAIPVAAALALAAAPAAPTRADVETVLKKEGRSGEQELPRLAASAEPILIAIAGDAAAEASLRARAVAALAYARTARAHVFLENLVLRKTPSSDPDDKLVLRRAAVSLGWQSGPRVVDILAPLLDHTDADVRLDAAVALGLCRAARAEVPLRAHLDEEPDPAVRRQIEASLRALAPDVRAGR
jgi:HEAT repeat protein